MCVCYILMYCCQSDRALPAAAARRVNIFEFNMNIFLSWIFYLSSVFAPQCRSRRHPLLSGLSSLRCTRDMGLPGPRPSRLLCCVVLLHLTPARPAYTYHASVPVRERSALLSGITTRHGPCRAQSVARESLLEEEDGRPSRSSFQPALPIPESSSTDHGYVLGAESIPPVLDALRAGSFVLLAEDAEEATHVSLVLAPQVSRAPLTLARPPPPPTALH